MNLQNQEELAKINKELEKEYINGVREELKNFPCFSGKSLYIWSNKLWYDLKEYERPDDLSFLVLKRSIVKSIKFLSTCPLPFNAYRYILTVVRAEMQGQTLDEGGFL